MVLSEVFTLLKIPVEMVSFEVEFVMVYCSMDPLGIVPRASMLAFNTHGWLWSGGRLFN